MAGTDLKIDYIARLARIDLTGDEKLELTRQLGRVIEYMDQLNQLDVSDVEPTSHPFPMTNITRPDDPGTSLDHEDAMRNAPSKSGGLFRVPKIVE